MPLSEASMAVTRRGCSRRVYTGSIRNFHWVINSRPEIASCRDVIPSCHSFPAFGGRRFVISISRYCRRRQCQVDVYGPHKGELVLA